MRALAVLLLAIPLAGCTVDVFSGAPAADVRVVSSVDFLGGGGWRYVVGEVENHGPAAATRVTLLAWPGEEDTPGHHLDRIGVRGVLAPGERAPFSLKLRPNATDHRLEVRAEGTREVPRLADALLLRNVTLGPAPYDNATRLLGELLNTGSVPLSVDIPVVYRNESGHVVFVARGVTDVRDFPSFPLVQPGETMRWLALLPDPGAPAWTSYHARAHAWPAPEHEAPRRTPPSWAPPPTSPP